MMMKRTIRSLWLPVLACSVCFGAGAALDNGIDPSHLGKGDWIYKLAAATNRLDGFVRGVTNVASLMAFEKSQGMDFVIVKAGTGATNYPDHSPPQFNLKLVQSAHAAGLKIFGYTRSYGRDISGEVALVGRVYGLGADGFILDAETEWQSARPWIGTNGPALALKLCSTIKSLFPNKFLGHAPFPIIAGHSTFPYKEFGFYCDAAMPQIYWENWAKYGIHSPREGIDWMDREWKQWQDSLKGADRRAIKPLAPVAWSLSPCKDNPGVTGVQINDFVDYLSRDPHAVTAGGYKGLSFYAAGAGENCVRTLPLWKAMSNVVISVARPK